MKDELKPIIQGLLKKSREGKVAWVHASTVSALSIEFEAIDPDSEDYAVSTSSYTINVFRNADIQENAVVRRGVRINIVNTQGIVIMSDLAYPDDEGYADLEELISLARKSITNEDTIIKEIMEGLSKPGVFGSTDTDDESIPF